MIPQKKNKDTRVQNKQKEEPMMLKKRLEPLRNIRPNVLIIQQYYNNFLEQFQMKQKTEILSQFNLLSQQQKDLIMQKINLCISSLQIPLLIQGYDRENIRKLVEAFLIFQSELKIQRMRVKQNQSGKNLRKLQKNPQSPNFSNLQCGSLSQSRNTKSSKMTEQQAKVSYSGWGLFSLLSNLVNTSLRRGKSGENQQNSSSKQEMKEIQKSQKNQHKILYQTKQEELKRILDPYHDD